MTRKETFLKKLRETFRTEAEDHLRALSSGVLEMAQAEEAQAAVLVEALYREAHSLKGAARSVNRTDIESVARSLEDVLGGIKRGEVARSAAVFDALHSVIDALGGLVASSEPAPVADLVQRLSDVAPGSGDAPEAVAAPSPEAVEDAGPAADAQAPPPPTPAGTGSAGDFGDHSDSHGQARFAPVPGRGDALGKAYGGAARR